MPPVSKELRLDLDFLMELVDGDQEIARELLGSLWEDTSQLARELEEALREANATRVGSIGHALKGVAASLGAYGLKEAGAQLQLHAASGELVGCPPLLEKVVGEVLTLEHYLAENPAA